MHPEMREAFRRAVLEVLPTVRGLAGQYVEPYEVWQKQSESQWEASHEERTDFSKVLSAASPALAEAGRPFVEVFLTHHPEFGRPVGFSNWMGSITRSPSAILDSAFRTLWHRHRSLEFDDDAVDRLVEEFARFVDLPTVRVRFAAQLLNFHARVDSFRFPAGLTVRRLSEEEVSAFHGGPVSTLGLVRARVSGPHEFVVEGEFDEPKRHEGQQVKETPPETLPRHRLDKAVLSLRTFKEGKVGYDYVHFTPVAFCPLPMLSAGHGDLYIPWGSYRLSEVEIEPLRSHAEMIFTVSDAAMEMACSRLADAVTRLRPQDRLVDAVIGMEALLLAGLRSEDRRGELKFRFSLHYATLFGTPQERHEAFRVAKSLYDLRSTIAHGNDEKRPRIAGEKVTLDEAAKRATAELRRVVRHFLPDAASAPYKRSDFWERGYFGLPQDDH